MNTPAHLVMGVALFGRRGDSRRTWAAFAGALAPDLSLYVLAGTSLAIGIPAGRVFDTLYYSDAWQRVFAVDNSFVLWGLALAAALLWRNTAAVAFTGAALVHLAFDFPLHSHDARMHFWPLTDWKFESPVSYWNRSEGGNVVGLTETGMVMALTAVLLRRHSDRAARAAFVALAAAQLAPTLVWAMLL